MVKTYSKESYPNIWHVFTIKDILIKLKIMCIKTPEKQLKFLSLSFIVHFENTKLNYSQFFPFSILLQQH